MPQEDSEPNQLTSPVSIIRYILCTYYKQKHNCNKTINLTIILQPNLVFVVVLSKFYLLYLCNKTYTRMQLVLSYIHSCSLVPRLSGTVLVWLHSCTFILLNDTCDTSHCKHSTYPFAQSCGDSVSTMDNASVSTSQFVSHFSRERPHQIHDVCV